MSESPIERKVKNVGKKKIILGFIFVVIVVAISGFVVQNFVLNLGQSLSEEGDYDRPPQDESILDVDAAYNGQERVVRREANIDVRVKNFTKAFENLKDTARINQGYIKSYDSRSEGDWRTGTIEIEVPAENFFTVRDKISDNIGNIEDETVSIEDRTGDVISMQAKKEFLQERKNWLESNESDRYYSSERERREDLRDVRENLNDIEFRQNRIRERGKTSTITVHMSEPASERPPRQYDPSTTIKDAFVNGYYGGLDVVKFGITAIGYVVPFLGYMLIFLIMLGMTTRAWRYWNKVLYPYIKSKTLEYTSKIRGD